MGKTGRRKQRQRRKHQQQRQVLNTADDVASDSISPSSALHKLRHADSKIRHSALIALHESILNKCNGRICLPVLQAVREQVVSNDLECAALASECLVGYLRQEDDGKGAINIESKQHQHREEATASWASVLLSRLQDCILKLSGDSDVQQLQKQYREKQYWYALAAPCIHALCLLIETNPSALEQILLQRQKFTEVVMTLLLAQSHSSAIRSSVPAPPSFSSLQKRIAIYAARTLHSALDENVELADTVAKYAPPDNSRHVWEHWFTSLACNRVLSETSVLMVQLHLIGGLVNLYQVSTDTRRKEEFGNAIVKLGISSTSTLNASSPPIVISPGADGDVSSERRDGSILTRTIQKFEIEQIHELELKFRTAHEMYESQQKDEKLEQEIIRAVKDRKEPAREIARRQKKLQEEEELKKTKLQLQHEDVDMEDAEGTVLSTKDVSSSHGKFQHREEPGEQVMEEALERWNEVLEPLHLALEVMANLLTSQIPRDDDDVDFMTDDNAVTTFPQKDSIIISALQEAEAGAELARLLSKLCQYKFLDTKEKQSDPIRLDVWDAIGKTCACLSNCVLSQVSVEEGSQRPWQVLFEYLLHHRSGTSIMAPLDAITSTMVVLVQAEPTLVEESHLRAFQNILTVHAGESLRNVVCMISVAVAHFAEASSRSVLTLSERTAVELTQAFIDLLQKGSPTPFWSSLHREILNAFMDWYGQDDFFPQVFDNLNVLSVFGNSLQQLKICESSALSSQEEDVIHNSEQFVEYKLKA